MIIDCLKKQYIDSIDAINRASFSHPWSRTLIESDMDNPNCFYAVGVEGDEVSGYAGMIVIAGEANITNVAVNPAKRRGGIGKALVSRLIEICKEEDFILVTLEVRKSNVPAIALYESLGFEHCGERKNYYDNGEAALIMTLTF